ncbi:phosphoglycerate kinase [Pasteuria penetrans]|uniref:phosphoglycerate kinase n=1 Tax=Pasteuria penetrans TaxID=86005 RepID=UPI000F900B5A|nr:phosphoglycerate kinase [Pasteuria penetrans]
MPKQSLAQTPVRGKRVLCRLDSNVPLTATGGVADDTRILASLPTLHYLQDEGARTIVLGHLGRPRGEVVPSLRMAPVAERVASLLRVPVGCTQEAVGESVVAATRYLWPGGILFLENVRFCPGETENDPELARQWAQLADLYVNDAFGVAHRRHASNYGVANHLPSVAGFLLEKEWNTLHGALRNPVRPFVALLGGAKVDDKIAVFHHLLDGADRLLIGGGMACAFLAAQGYRMGRSTPSSHRVIEQAKRILSMAKPQQLQLPVDVCVADSFLEKAESRVVGIRDVEDCHYVLDIGPRTRGHFLRWIQEAGQVIWNGPMGVFEWPSFAEGTKSVASAMAQTPAKTIVGGGDSLAALQQMGYLNAMNHFSTGGGAMLALLAGKSFPAWDILDESWEGSQGS